MCFSIVCSLNFNFLYVKVRKSHLLCDVNRTKVTFCKNLDGILVFPNAMLSMDGITVAQASSSHEISCKPGFDRNPYIYHSAPSIGLHVGSIDSEKVLGGG